MRADGSLAYEPIAVFNQALARFDPVPIDFGAATDKLFLVLYGTGIRGRAMSSPVTATMGGVSAEVLFAGMQGGLVGLDQVNLRLPRTLAGRGVVNVELSVDGKAANVVTVQMK